MTTNIKENVLGATFPTKTSRQNPESGNFAVIRSPKSHQITRATDDEDGLNTSSAVLENNSSEKPNISLGQFDLNIPKLSFGTATKPRLLFLAAERPIKKVSFAPLSASPPKDFSSVSHNLVSEQISTSEVDENLGESVNIVCKFRHKTDTNMNTSTSSSLINKESQMRRGRGDEDIIDRYNTLNVNDSSGISKTAIDKTKKTESGLKFADAVDATTGKASDMMSKNILRPDRCFVDRESLVALSNEIYKRNPVKKTEIESACLGVVKGSVTTNETTEDLRNPLPGKDIEDATIMEPLFLIVPHQNTGALTSEARDSDRRRRVHLQLQHARRLRETMEQLADQAQNMTPSEAKQLLFAHRADVNELIALTQAVRGRYTLDSYHVITMQQEEEEREAQVKTDNAKAVVYAFQRNLAEERNPELKRIRLEREAEEQLSLAKEGTAQPQQEQESATEMSASERPGSLFPQERDLEVILEDKKPAASELASISSSKGTPNSTRKRRKKRKQASVEESQDIPKEVSPKLAPTTTKKQDDPSINDDTSSLTSSLAKRAIQRKRAKQAIHVAAGDDTLSLSVASSVDDSTTHHASLQAAFATPKRSRGSPSLQKRASKPPPEKKCHQCRERVTVYVRCRYCMITGIKCLKPFCPNCLQTHYKMDADSFAMAQNNKEWFCPSCLKYCTCAPCNQERQRDERRQASSRSHTTRRLTT